MINEAGRSTLCSGVWMNILAGRARLTLIDAARRSSDSSLSAVGRFAFLRLHGAADVKSAPGAPRTAVTVPSSQRRRCGFKKLRKERRGDR